MTPVNPQREEPAAGHVAIGRVLAPRGLRGEVKVEPFSDHDEHFAVGRTVWARGSGHRVEGSRRRQGRVYLKLADIDSAEAAEALRGSLLTLPEAELGRLPDGEYYRFQILGMDVYDIEGAHLGRVAEVLATGGNDVYVVRGERGVLLLPAIDDVVREVDLGSRRMVVELMEGMLPS
jgi:16S rRNA processing protein RimM